MKKKTLLLACIMIGISWLHAQQFAIQGVQLNRAVPDGRVDKVWEGLDMEQGFSGKDVIIGFTDWGFDFTHPVFYDTAMTEYRVLRAWDQYRNSGPSPSDFSYGTELRGKEMLLAAQSDTSNVYGYGYHGTHVASIAAGAGAGTRYRGVAYGADMLFVSILVDENAIMDAFRWMHRVSLEEHKRLVINMSWGLYYVGNMDGTGRMADLVDSLSREGVVFVTSGGNNGDVRFHLGHTFSGTAETIHSQIGYASGSDRQWGQSVSMSGSPNTSFSFAISVLNTSNEQVAVTPFFDTRSGDFYKDTLLVPQAGDTMYYNFHMEASNPYNARPQVRLRVKKTLTNKYKWVLTVAAENGEFHAWNLIELTNDVGNWGGPFVALPAGGHWKGGDYGYGIGTPGNIQSLITIAAHASSYTLDGGGQIGGMIADFSSYGPTIDGRMKPEISAPGRNVIGALSSFTDQYWGTISRNVEFNGKIFQFVPLSGTSMSSPFVAGVVALMLEANPYLTPSQVKHILTETAYQDQYTEQSGTERFGYGKTDAWSAVMNAFQTIGISGLTVEDASIKMYPNPASGYVHIVIRSEYRNFEMEIFDFCGKLLEKQIINTGVNTISTQSLVPGCYFIRISDGNNVWVEKLIKN